MSEAATKSFTLKRSKLTVSFDPDYGVAETIAAQKASRKNSGLFALYLAQQIATFDGKKLTVGEIREKIKGADYLQLTQEILGGDDDDAEDGDEPGKALQH